MLKKIGILFLLTALGLLGLQGLFGAGWYTSHDGMAHLVRLGQYVTLLTDGQLPPRWSGSLNGGLGYPIFNYSYHLPYIIGSGFYWISRSLVGSLKAVMIVSFISSGWGAYWWLRKRFSRPAALVGALLFLMAPYRFVLIYVRVGLGEMVALGLMPWILGAIERKRWRLAGILISAGVVAFPLFLFMFLPVVILVSLGEKKQIRGLITSLIIAGGLAAFYLLPIIGERQFIIFDSQYKNLAIGHLLALKQLIYSKWGYGFSHSGVEQDAMAFQLGISQQLAVLGAGLIFLIKKNKDKLRAFFWLTVFFGSVAMMVDWPGAHWFWTKFPGASVMDISWRLLGLTVLASSWLGAWLVDSVWPAVRFFGGVSLIVLAVYGNRNHWRVNQAVFITNEEIFQSRLTTTYLNEYRPKWRLTTTVPEQVLPKVYSLSETEKINVKTTRSNLWEVETNFSQPTVLQINQLYFPGWKVRVNNQTVEPEIVALKENDNDFGKLKFKDIEGTMRLNLPAGRQEIRMKFEETRLRKIGNLILLICLGFEFGFATRRWRH